MIDDTAFTFNSKKAKTLKEKSQDIKTQRLYKHKICYNFYRNESDLKKMENCFPRFG